MSLEKPNLADLEGTLLSASYWQAGEAELPTIPYWKNIADKDVVYDIGSIVTSAAAGYSITPIEYGTELPTVMHPRQVLKVIEDNGGPVPRRLERRQQRNERRVNKALAGLAASFGLPFSMPSPQDLIDHMYDVDIPICSSVHFARPLDKRRALHTARSVLYMRPYDDGTYAGTGIFAALHPIGTLPNCMDRVTLTPMPAVRVGELYSKTPNPKSTWRGRIASAELIEVSGVNWQSPPKGGGRSSKSGKETAGRLAWKPQLTPYKA